MTRPLDNNPNIAISSPLHRNGHIGLLSRIDNVLRQSTYFASLLFRITAHLVWQTRVIRKQLVINRLGLLGMPGSVRPLVVDFLTG
jgi:hypothetical protein